MKRSGFKKILGCFLSNRRADIGKAHTEKTPITSQLWDRRPLDENESVTDHMSDSISDVGTTKEKLTSQSAMKISYDFKANVHLRYLYEDSNKGVLIGKLFEDLDAFAGTIAGKHCDDQNSKTKSLSLVTASVDKIIQKSPILTSEEYTLFGKMVYVGRSSMDILIEMYKSSDVDLSTNAKNGPNVLSSFFTFAARDPSTGKSTQVNPLRPETTEEIELFEIRQKMANNRSKNPHDSTLDKSILTPLVERGSAIVDMPALAHPNAVLMTQTGLENCFICQPQNVNTAGTIFGGFLMHRAYDLAVASSYTFAGAKPQFIEVDKIEFRKPVEIGELVRMKSRVVYTSDDPISPTVHVEVICQVVCPERASSYVSNKFTFIFGFRDSVTLRRVLPQTYEQAARLLQASKWTFPALNHGLLQKGK